MSLLCLAGLGAILAATGATELLHDFADPGVWVPNADGGRTVRAEAHPEGGMRVRYTDAAPHWGNLVGPSAAPAGAIALRVHLRKLAADSGAALHVWLLEPDNDAWVQRLSARGVSVGQWPNGRLTVDAPISGFAFEARGPGSRQMQTCNRMLIGFNYGDIDVVFERMEWVLGGASTGSAPLPKWSGAPATPGKRGSVTILDMGTRLPDNWRPAHSVAGLRQALAAAGFAVRVAQAGDLLEPGVLVPSAVQALVLPYGPFFPARCRDVFLAYLRAGGSFLSTDGYAFDRLVDWNGERWVDVQSGITVEQTSSPIGEVARINTRYGRQGDAMTFEPSQLGVFDPAFPLERATRAGASEWYRLTQGASVPALRWPTPISGYAACCLTGANNPVFPPTYRRWIPVLTARDARGSSRGELLSLVRNHAGEYAGSSWAISGITSKQDLFLGTPTRRRMLTDVIDRLISGVCLHSLTTDLACYRSGEAAKVSVVAANFGSTAFSGQVSIAVGGREVLLRAVRLAPGEQRTVTASVMARADSAGLAAIRVRLLRGAGCVDALDGAFSVWSSAVLARGPKLGWSGNYFTIGGKPRILLGSNQTGMMFYAAGEGPRIWDRDFALMRRQGLRVLRILHFSPFAARGYEGQAHHTSLDLRNRPERLRRQMDAIVQTAQRHGVCVLLTLHDWLGVGLTDEELAAQADWNRFWAARYKDVPGVFYDIQNEPSVDVPDRPDILKLWNQWLAERYGSDEGLREAWHARPPDERLPNVPFGTTVDQWDDVRSADRKRFETEILNRWVSANVRGIREGNPKALVCVGYLPSMAPADKVLGTRQTTFSNMHYYGPVDGFPLETALIDRRAMGKGLSIGEFGAQEAHTQRNHGADVSVAAESIQRFSATVHYGVGLGASMLCNWSLRELDEMVFPWGLFQRNSPVPRPWAERFGGMARWLAQFEPVYTPPAAYILIPDAHRIGPKYEMVHAAARRAVELLLDLNVPFGMLNEEDLNRIPAGARAIFWPVPYCPSDEVFARVKAWVRAGGTMYFSGSLAFDRARRPNRTMRMEELGLPAEASPPFDDDHAVTPVRTVSVGNGRVVWAPYPLELKKREDDRAIYAGVAEAAGVARLAVEADNAHVRAQMIHGRNGTRLYVLERVDDVSGIAQAKLRGTSVKARLAPRSCSFVLTGPGGRVLSSECDGIVVP